MNLVFNLNNNESSQSFVLELAEHVLEDTTVLEVSDLWVSIESAGNSEALSAFSCNIDVLADLEVTTLHVNRELLITSKTMHFSGLASLELHGENTHTNQVRSVDSFV